MQCALNIFRKKRVELWVSLLYTGIPPYGNTALHYMNQQQPCILESGYKLFNSSELKVSVPRIRYSDGAGAPVGCVTLYY